MDYIDISGRESTIEQDYTSEELKVLRRKGVIHTMLNIILFSILGLLVYSLFAIH